MSRAPPSPTTNHQPTSLANCKGTPHPDSRTPNLSGLMPCRLQFRLLELRVHFVSVAVVLTISRRFFSSIKLHSLHPSGTTILSIFYLWLIRRLSSIFFLPFPPPLHPVNLPSSHSQIAGSLQPTPVAGSKVRLTTGGSCKAQVPSVQPELSGSGRNHWRNLWSSGQPATYSHRPSAFPRRGPTATAFFSPPSYI